jgi:hypothetical protein
MHLEELFQLIGQNRRDFIARRAEKVGTTGSAAGVVSQGGNKGEKTADDETEPVQVEVGAGAPAGD